MTKAAFNSAFLIGAVVVTWMGSSFVGSDTLALAMIALIGVVYVFGAWELVKFRQATTGLSTILAQTNSPVEDLSRWISALDGSLQNAVRSRIDGDKVGLPGPVLTPYLVGLLVMLGLLGTFAGMVGTLKGAVFALQGTTELEAIRAGLAAPMKGLGLAFGTSVAGVAASALLGLMSTLSRRERMIATRDLDAKIPECFQAFSLVHNRQSAYQVIQNQAQLMPEVAERLQLMAERIEQMGGQLATQLTQSQQAFQESNRAVFTELASTVETALKDSLSESGKLAGESIQPVVSDAMATITEQVAQQVKVTHETLAQTASAQLEAMTHQLSESSANIVAGFTQQGEQWLQTTQENDQKRLNVWVSEFEKIQAQSNQQFTLQTSETVSALEQAASSQKSLINNVSSELEQLISHIKQSTLSIVDHSAESSSQMANESQRLVHASEELIKKRMETEQSWLDGQNKRIEQIADNLQEALSALREEESDRGKAAVERLALLEENVATHLGTLGVALEQPMTRLIETASETPKAAAEVIGHLRREISNNIERDNKLLTERQEIMANVNALFSSMENSSTQQRQAIDQLVQTSADTLSQVSEQFTRHVDQEVGKLAQIGEHFEGSAVEMASLGDAFGKAVTLFNDSNRQLLESLTRIEVALEHSANRSDEQLGYYVAQAREIIDHSMLSQKELFEELKQLGKDQRVVDAAV